MVYPKQKEVRCCLLLLLISALLLSTSGKSKFGGLFAQSTAKSKPLPINNNSDKKSDNKNKKQLKNPKVEDTKSDKTTIKDSQQGTRKPVDANNLDLSSNKEKVPVKQSSGSSGTGDSLSVGQKSSNESAKEHIWLTLEKYQQLLDQIDNLKRKIKSEKAGPPSECKIEGTIEERGKARVVHLHLIYRCRTTEANTILFLGLQKAQTFDAQWEDGQLPFLIPGEDGLKVLVEQAGEHRLQIHTECLINSLGEKGNEVGFELQSSGSPITLLHFRPFDGIRQFTLIRKENSAKNNANNGTNNGDTLPDQRTVTSDQLQRAEGLPLGAVRWFALQWENLQTNAPKALTSQSLETTVTISDNEIQSETKIHLGGPGKTFKIAAPASAEINIRSYSPASPDTASKPIELPFDQLPTLIRPAANQPGVWSIIFRESVPKNLQLLVTDRRQLPQNNPGGNKRNDPRARLPIAILPALALDIPISEGIIHIKYPAIFRIVGHPHGDTRRMETASTSPLDMQYHFQHLAKGNPIPIAPLEIEIFSVPGTIQNRSKYQLDWSENGWKLRTEFRLQPQRREIDQLTLEIPRSGELSDLTILPLDQIESINEIRDIDPQRRLIQVQLSVPQKNLFTLTVEGIYSARLFEATQDANSGNTSMTRTEKWVLPRILNTYEREAEVAVSLPSDYQLQGGVKIWQKDKIGQMIHPLTKKDNQWVTSLQRETPAQLEFSWYPNRPRIQARTVVSLHWFGHSLRYQESLHLQSALALPRQIKLQSAQPVNITTTSDNVTIEPLNRHQWLISQKEKGLKQLDLQLEYTAKPPKLATLKSLATALPLLWPEQTSQSTMKVRIWFHLPNSGTNPQPILGQDWRSLPPEIVADQPELPALVLESDTCNAGLSFRFDPSIDSGKESVKSEAVPPEDPAATAIAGEKSDTPLQQIWPIRTFIQVQQNEVQQRYRIRTILRTWNSSHWPILFPENTVDLETWINGKKINLSALPNQNTAQFLTKVPLPEQINNEPLMIEWRYQLSTLGPKIRWVPPIFLNGGNMGTVRWQGQFPATWEDLCLQRDIVLDDSWGFDRGLPRHIASNSSTELENWFLSGIEPSARSALNMMERSWDLMDRSVSFQQAEIAPVHWLMVSRLGWIISWSSILILLFLFRLGKKYLPQRYVLACIAVTWFMIWLSYPRISYQIIMACIPGYIVIMFILGLRYFLAWRQQYRIRHLSSFRRTMLDVSLSPSGSSQRAKVRDPSTMDSPPLADIWSSANRS